MGDQEKSFLSGLSTWRPGGAFLGTASLGGILVYLVVPPIAMLVWTSMSSATLLGPEVFSLKNYQTILTSGASFELLFNTFVFAIGSSLLGLLLGGILAWLVERTNTPFAGLAYIAVFLSFATPGVLKVIGWILILGPKAGYANVFFRRVLNLGIESGPFNIFSMYGMILVEGVMWSTLVFLLMAAPLRSMDPALEEAATTSGAGVWRTIYKVTLKLALPSVLSVILLAFVRCLEAFEVPALVGLPARVPTFTATIYYETRENVFPNYGVASAYAVLLLALVGVGLYLYTRATRAAYKFYTITGKGFRPKVMDLGRWRYVTMVAVFIIPFLEIAPLIMLIWISFLPHYGWPTAELVSRLTLANYTKLLESVYLINSAKNSLIVSFVSATLAVLLATTVAWVAVRTKIRGRGFLDLLTSLPLVFPGVVLGLAMIRIYLTIPIPIYGTLLILMVGFITRYLPYAMRYCHPGLLQISSELEESAYTCGASWMSTFRKILIPLMMPSIFAAWMWIFLVSFRELSLALMLSGPRTPVISVGIFELWENGQITEVGALGTVVSVFLIILSLAMQRFSRRYGVKRKSGI